MRTKGKSKQDESLLVKFLHAVKEKQVRFLYYLFYIKRNYFKQKKVMFFKVHPVLLYNRSLFIVVLILKNISVARSFNP